MKESSPSIETRVIQTVRAGFYVLIVLLVVLQNVSQSEFLNWDLNRTLLVVATLGLSMHLGSFLNLEKLFRNRNLLAVTFLVDWVLLSALLWFAHLPQTFFLFLNLIQVLGAGVIFGVRGSLALAALYSISSLVILILGPELKTFSFYFQMSVNTLAYFVIASISGMLAEQLEAQGIRVSVLRKLNESIVETIPDGLLSIDSSGIVLQFNPGARALFKNESLSGKNLTELLPGVAWKTWIGKGKQVWVQDSGAGATRYQIQILPQRLEDDGENYLVVIEDQTQLQKLEFAVRQSEKLAAVGQLAAGIAHEIRNPLAGMSGSLELLKSHFESDDDRRLFRNIMKEIDRLNRLIGEFLDFAKPEKPPTEFFALESIVREVLTQVQQDTKIKNPQIEIAMKTDLKIRCHPEKLKQALLNILINAFQAMDKLDVQVLKVQSFEEDQKIVLRIEDRGCGMSDETRRRMFEPFHTTKPKGTGLGLAITLKILEAHQAQIFVESEIGKGTVFEIRFPST